MVRRIALTLAFFPAGCVTTKPLTAEADPAASLDAVTMPKAPRVERDLPTAAAAYGTLQRHLSRD